MPAAPQDLPTVADELYGLDPAAFTAARNERAGAAKDAGNTELAQQITGLRKPTAAAWAVNLLVRRRRADLQRLLSLADQLRTGAGDRTPAELRELNRMAQRVVTAVTRLAADLAAEHGHPLSSALVDRVHQTLRASMADPAAAGAVLSGRLVTTLEASALAGLGVGSGPADVSAAVAVPVTVTSLAARSAGRASAGDGESDDAVSDREARRRASALAAARRASERADSEAEQALEQARSATDRTAELHAELERLTAAVERTRRRLRDQENELNELRRHLADADRNRRHLDEQARAARQRADDAETTVRLLSEPDGE